MADKKLQVAAAIIVREGKVLAAQRAHGMEGGWELPGGKLEPGETAEEACRREIREELGMELGVLWPFTSVSHSYPEFDIDMEVFCAPVSADAEPQMLDHKALTWLGRDELLTVEWLPADLEVVRSFGLNWVAIFEDMHM
jgi:8-oxo-dGTP diphosphatase